MTDVIARSGHAGDIQDAWDQTVVGDNLILPGGVFDLYEVGETWGPITGPTGINVFGAPTVRDANGQVIAWKTTLNMPEEAPNLSEWFRFLINNNLPIRFSDTELVGYRYHDIASTTIYTGVKIFAPYRNSPIDGILDFRVDHCNFQDIAGSAINFGDESEYNRRVCRGVIDHNRLVNTYGNPGIPYEDRTLGYGIGLRRWASDTWEPDISKVLGKYTDYTVFIEDNYFTKWRHPVCTNDGFHQVFRHNVVEGGYGIGESDGHGSYADPSHPYAVGTRALEVYENTFKNPDTTWTTVPWAINHRGGGGIFTKNTLINYNALCDLNNDWGNYDPYCPQCHINDTYIWNNTLNGARLIKYNSDNVENVNYFLRAPSLAQDGWEYTPYPSPHPLVTEKPLRRLTVNSNINGVPFSIRRI